MKTLIVNFYGGPGCGKSTMAARIFAELKQLGWNVELATEYAKDLTWEESHRVLTNQVYVFAKQHHRIWRLLGKVKIILTDSSLLNSLVYCKDDTSEEFKSFVKSEFLKNNNVNINLRRVKKYNTAGRSQTEAEAIQLDSDIRQVVNDLCGFDLEVDGDATSVPAITEYIINSFNNINNIK